MERPMCVKNHIHLCKISPLKRKAIDLFLESFSSPVLFTSRAGVMNRHEYSLQLVVVSNYYDYCKITSKSTYQGPVISHRLHLFSRATVERSFRDIQNNEEKNEP